MKKPILILLISIVYLYGCRKNDTTGSPATATTGTISGIINPPTAATLVTASQVINGNIVTYTAAPDNHGSFILTNLPAGNYTLAFTVASGYIVPDSQTDTVIAGKNTNAGTITVLVMPSSISGNISPAGAAAQLRITNTAGGTPFDVAIIPDTATGGFKLTNIPAGNYTLSATANLGYSAPADQILTVTDGQNTDVATLTFDTVESLGSISGTASPVSDVMNVTATWAGLNYTVVPDADGSFKINNLPPGKYTLTVNPAAGSALYASFIRPVLVEGQPTDVGTMALRTSGMGYTAICTIDGTAFSTPGFSSRYASSNLTISGLLVLQFNAYLFSLSLNGVTGVGEFKCNSNTGSSITLATFDESSFWSTGNTGASGIVKITAFDPVTHHFSATFSGILTSGINASDTTTITNGKLTDFQYQTP